MLRSHVTLAALAAAALATGCHSSSDGKPTTPSNKAEPQGVSQVGADELGFLPADADVIAGFDAAALRNSAVWKQFEPQITAGLGADYDRFKTACGWDPVQQIQSLTFAGKMLSESKFEGVFVVRGVSGTGTLDCIAKEMQDKSAVTNEGGVLTVTDRDTKNKMIATIVGGSVLVGVTVPDGSTLTLEKALHTATPLRTSQAFMALYNRREPGAAVWGMVNGNSPILQQMGEGGAKPSSMDGTLVIRDTFDGTMRVTFATPDGATAMQKQLDQVGAMFGKQMQTFEARVDGSTFVLHVIATAEQIKGLLGMFGAF